MADAPDDEPTSKAPAEAVPTKRQIVLPATAEDLMAINDFMLKRLLARGDQADKLMTQHRDLNVAVKELMDKMSEMQGELDTLKAAK